MNQVFSAICPPTNNAVYLRARDCSLLIQYPIFSDRIVDGGHATKELRFPVSLAERDGHVTKTGQ